MSVASSVPHPQSNVAIIPTRIAQLRASFASGKTRSLDWRRDQLERLETMLREDGEKLVAALKADLHKPDFEAWFADLGAVAGESKLARKQLARWTRPERVSTPLDVRPAKSRIVREPLGVVLIIAPWNYPVQLLLSPLVGAIAAGNCAVLKPSEVTPHTSATLSKIVPRHLDPECFEIFEGGVGETSVLLEQRFDHIFYTGNGHVGRIVMEAAAKHLTPVTLELGGKSPCIVDESADLDVAARRIAWGKFMNAGQTCVAPDYVLVHEAVEAELVAKLGETIRRFYGEDPKQSKHYARVVNERHHARLTELLEGAEVAVGGDADASECYLAPTLVPNVKPDSPLMRDEIFGPILPILKVRDVDEAIDLVAEREKPLALYLFTGSEESERKVVEQTSSGGVCVNATIYHLANPNLPFGGVGASGMGTYHGRASFEAFSHRKPVMTKSTRVDPKLAYPPYSRLLTALIRRRL